VLPFARLTLQRLLVVLVVLVVLVALVALVAPCDVFLVRQIIFCSSHSPGCSLAHSLSGVSGCESSAMTTPRCPGMTSFSVVPLLW
jgi:hypothetical protein